MIPIEIHVQNSGLSWTGEFKCVYILWYICVCVCNIVVYVVCLCVCDVYVVQRISGWLRESEQRVKVYTSSF